MNVKERKEKDIKDLTEKLKNKANIVDMKKKSEIDKLGYMIPDLKKEESVEEIPPIEGIEPVDIASKVEVTDQAINNKDVPLSSEDIIGNRGAQSKMNIETFKTQAKQSLKRNLQQVGSSAINPDTGLTPTASLDYGMGKAVGKLF
jgi:hypothetical protein